MTKEDREPWDLLAMRDKARFRYEMANYDGPMKILKGSKIKDPNAPKRPTSAFLAYSKAKRPAIMAEHPTMRTTEVSVILSGMWKEEDPAVKQYYTDQVNAQLEIYKIKAREHKQDLATAAQKRESEAMEQAMEAGFNNPEVEPVHTESKEDSGHIVGSEMDPMLDGLTADEVDLCFESNFEWDPIPLANDTSLSALEHPMQQESQPVGPPAAVSPMQQEQTPQKQKPKKQTPQKQKPKKPKQAKPKKQKQPRKVQPPKVPDLEAQPTTVVPDSGSVFWRPSASPHLSHMNRAVAASLQHHATQQGPSTPPGSLMAQQLQLHIQQQQLMLNQHHQQLLQQYRQTVRPSTPQAPAFWGGTTPPHPMGHAVSVTPDQPTRQMVLLPNNANSPQVTTMVAPSCVPSQPLGSPPGISTPPGHQWVLVQTLPAPPNLNNLSTPPPLGFLQQQQQQPQQMAAQQQQQHEQPAPWTAAWSSSGGRNNAGF